VFVAYPDPEGKTKSGRATGYSLPGGWENTAANPAYVNAWRPGRALCAVMGCGLDLVDVDPRNGGDLAALDGILPEVIGEAESPSGGLHLFIASMGVRSRDDVLPGIDVKAGVEGAAGRGFAFIAPTVRVSKTTGERVAYRWVKPPGLTRLNGSDPSGAQLAALVRPAHGKAASRFSQPGGHSEGWTDPDIAQLIREGIPRGEAQQPRLRDVVARLVGQGYDRVTCWGIWQAIVDRTALTKPEWPWAEPDFSDMYNSAARKYGATPRRAAESGTTDNAEPLAWAHIIDWHQAWAGKPDHVEWLLEPLLERGTLNAWFGKPAAGKSLIALEVAAGRPVLGGAVQEPMTVLYVDVENAVNGIVERLQAYGYEPGDLKRLIYSSFPDVPGLDTFAGGQFLLSAAEAHNPALVIIDTTSRIIAGKENDADTFLQLYRHALVPLKQRGITVLRLDHPGKDLQRGQRGSSAKDGDVDTVWLIEHVSQGGINFERRKSRNDHGAGSLYLTRKFEPLRHEPGGFGMAPRNADILEALAALHAPADITNRAAAKLLREDGKRVRAADLTVALRKWREHAGNTLFPEAPETPGNTETPDPGPSVSRFPERSEETGNGLPPEPGQQGEPGGFAAGPVSLREDTHEEQEQLYPARLAVHRRPGNPEFLPTRAEWARPEAARQAILTQCASWERVPSGAEHYLSPAELDEMRTLYRELCQSVRPVVTAEIKRLRALLPSQRPDTVRERSAWYLALSEDDQTVAGLLSALEGDRRDLGRVLRDGGPGPSYNPLLQRDVAELVPGQDKLSRYKELLATLDSAHKAAGLAAEDAAVSAEQARRLTDEGWAQELAGRESLEEYFSRGPLREEATP
jgi:hypothetical protein